MERVRMGRTLAIGGLLCAAMMALSVGTASAAAPVFFGKAAVGSTVASVPFTGSGESSFFEDKSGTKITCAKTVAFSGEISGATEMANVQLTLGVCETGGTACGVNQHEGGGEVSFETLAGALGNVTPTTPGIRLFNQSTGRGGVLLEFTCSGGAVKVTLRGSVIGAVSGASGTSVAEGKLAASPKLAFVESKGIQKYAHFLPGEGEAGTEQAEANVGAGYEPVGVAFTKPLALKSTPLAGQFGVTK
jgi:hypothetical protein